MKWLGLALVLIWPAAAQELSLSEYLDRLLKEPVGLEESIRRLSGRGVTLSEEGLAALLLWSSSDTKTGRAAEAVLDTYLDVQLELLRKAERRLRSSGFLNPPQRPLLGWPSSRRETKPSQTGWEWSLPSFGDSGITFYSGDVSGTTMKFGDIWFHDLDDGTSGTTMQFGDIWFHDFDNGVSGASMSFGDMIFHDFNNGLSGTTMKFGDTIFTDFSNGLNCTTSSFGDMSFTDCF